MFLVLSFDIMNMIFLKTIYIQDLKNNIRIFDHSNKKINLFFVLTYLFSTNFYFFSHFFYNYFINKILLMFLMFKYQTECKLYKEEYILYL